MALHIMRPRKLFIGTRLMFFLRRLGYDWLLRPVLSTKQSPPVLVAGDRGAYVGVRSSGWGGGACIHSSNWSLAFEK